MSAAGDLDGDKDRAHVAGARTAPRTLGVSPLGQRAFVNATGVVPVTCRTAVTERGGAREAEVRRHPLHRDSSGTERRNARHDARPLAPRLERELRLGREQPADRARRRTGGARQRLQRSIRSRGPRARARRRAGRADRSVAARTWPRPPPRSARTARARPAARSAVVSVRSTETARGSSRAAADRPTRRARDASRPDSGCLDDARLADVHGAHLQIAQHVDHVLEPGRQPHRPLGRHEPAARRRRHLHHAARGEQQLRLAVRVPTELGAGGPRARQDAELAVRGRVVAGLGRRSAGGWAMRIGDSSMSGQPSLVRVDRQAPSSS